MLLRRFSILCVLLCAGVAAGAEPVADKDLTILQLRRALAAEKLERLRLEFLVTKIEHDRVSAEIEAKRKKESGNED